MGGEVLSELSGSGINYVKILNLSKLILMILKKKDMRFIGYEIPKLRRR